MADSKLTALPQLTAPATGDQVYVVDVSDTTDDAAGSSKRILLSDLAKIVGARVPIETIERATAGEFDFDNIPQGYKRLVIEGDIRSTQSGSIASTIIVLNTDDTGANYHLQVVRGDDGAASAIKAANNGFGRAPAAAAPAGAFAHTHAVLEGYAAPDRLRGAVVRSGFLYEAAKAFVGLYSVTNKALSDPITRIRIRTDNHPTDGLVGMLTLYGEY